MSDPAPDVHKLLAIDLFNHTWALLDKKGRTTAEDDEMVHAAHASRLHWGRIGKPVNLARGEWQISRVYSVLKRSEPALHHAQRCLAICEEHSIGDFDLAYAHEALARAFSVAGESDDAKRHAATARQIGEKIAEKEDREHFLADLETI